MMPRTTRRALSLIAAIAAAATAVGCEKKAPLHGMTIPDPQPAPALLLHDFRGWPFDLSKERGRTVLLYFGYTHCPDVCPTTLADFARARRMVNADTARLRFVFVSVDPERDTPALAASYARQFDSTFTGLAPTAAELNTIKTAGGFAVSKEDMPGMAGYGVTHPAGVFVIDRDGKVRFVFAPGTKSEELASDLRLLL
jgi:protein SCO1/2